MNNNLYPQNYMQSYPQYMPNMMQPQLQNQAIQPFNQVQPYNTPQKPQEGKIWVHGEDVANNYFVAPNESVTLWDDKEPIFYDKSADSSGRPTMTMYQYEKIDSASDREKNNAIKSLDERVRVLESQLKKGSKNAKSESNTNSNESD